VSDSPTSVRVATTSVTARTSAVAHSSFPSRGTGAGATVAAETGDRTTAG